MKTSRVFMALGLALAVVLAFVAIPAAAAKVFYVGPLPTAGVTFTLGLTLGAIVQTLVAALLLGAWGRDEENKAADDIDSEWPTMHDVMLYEYEIVPAVPAPAPAPDVLAKIDEAEREMFAWEANADRMKLDIEEANAIVHEGIRRGIAGTLKMFDDIGDQFPAPAPQRWPFPVRTVPATLTAGLRGSMGEESPEPVRDFDNWRPARDIGAPSYSGVL